MTPEERFWAKVEKTDDCWRWTGALTPQGYGSFRGHEGVTVSAHRWIYERVVGPIAPGLFLDHTCHNRQARECPGNNGCVHRRCVNPDHLEPVTNRENVIRGFTGAGLDERCRRGHIRSPENTYIQTSTGRRFCRDCRKVREGK